MSDEKVLTIGVPYVPENPNHLEINSLYDYVIFDDLLRPLVKLDSSGEIVPDLSSNWEIQDDFRKYIFTLKTEQFFSDGSLIDSDAAVNSLNKLAASSTIVHGDGKKIKKITKLDSTRFEIELFESDPFFLSEISAPEFRISKGSADEGYHITSGPYFLDKTSAHGELNLKINPKYPFNRTVKYKQVNFKKYDANNQISNELLQNFDIVWPKSILTKDEMDRFIKFGFNIYQLNLGFSYWFSLNPKSLTLEERIVISEKMNNYLNGSSFFEKNNLNRARQLYLPDGPGRLTKGEVDALLKNQKFSSLRVDRVLIFLLPKNIQPEILKAVDALGLATNVAYYENFSDYANLVRTNTYDAAYVNNDLSAIDLRPSLIVTFNPSRPLVFIDENEPGYASLLRAVKGEQVSAVRYKRIKELGRRVLQDALVVPVYYKMGIVLVKGGVDLSGWDRDCVETCVWKVK